MIKIINEGTSYKRIARYGEFDNGHVFHNWKRMTSDEAENMAKQASIKDPNDIYYVAYDDIMSDGSDLRWINGKSYHYSEVEIRYGKPYIKDKSKVTETVGKSKYFTKPFADAIKSKFNIDMTGKTSEEFE